MSVTGKLGVNGIATQLAYRDDGVPFALNNRVDLAANRPDILVQVDRRIVRRRRRGGPRARRRNG